MKKLFILLTIPFLFILNNVSVFAWEYDGSDNLYFDYTPTYNESYYSSLDGVSKEDFKDELNDVISANYNRFTYSNRYTVLKVADALHDDSSSVWCLYTGKIFSVNDNGSSGTSSFNTEHTWAKSWGFPSDSSTPYTDMHHLRITECAKNSTRGNLWFGEVSSGSSDSYGNKWSSSMFEPRDSVKGDVARMLLYMDVRYDGENGEPDLVLIDGYSATSGSALHGDLTTLLKWHEEDPVDDRERLRNDVVFSYQKNRNPFIDHPEYVNTIWGEELSDEEIASTFDNMVNDISTPITVSSILAINNALEYYNTLTNSQKALTSNYNLLLKYQEDYMKLVGEEGEAAYSFDLMVDEIGVVTLDSKDKIFTALEFYDLLSDTSKDLTTNYELLLSYYEEYIILEILFEVEDDLDILDLILKGDYESLFDYIN